MGCKGIPFVDSLPKCPQLAGLGHAEAKSQELQLGLSSAWQQNFQCEPHQATGLEGEVGLGHRQSSMGCTKR